MDEQVPLFLAVTGIEDHSVATHFLELTNGDLDYAVSLYMESNPPENANVQPSNDEEVARRLQSEAYGGSEDTVREADTNIHRHETLVDSFDNVPSRFNPSNPADIFGQGRIGVFNQRYDDEEMDFYHDRDYSDSPQDDEEQDDSNADSDDAIMVLDSDEEVERPAVRGRRRLNRSGRMNTLTSTQRRLANLFRPPFDIMEKINIDTAKIEGRKSNKWILINIQDNTEFICQVLNRDFWSSSKVKSKVRENFIFLQYQKDSVNGSTYGNFYSIDQLPHIAILDPLTGERVHKWPEGVIPDVEKWLEDVDKFLINFSLLPDSDNPVVKHERKFDPNLLSEEQQIEYAMKQSVSDKKESRQDDPIVIDDNDENESDDAEKAAAKETETSKSALQAEYADPYASIEPENHVAQTGQTTNIQFRFPNGKRVVHKFDLSDEVISLFKFLKYLQSEDASQIGVSSEDRLSLSNTSNRSFSFIDSLNLTIDETNLKNVSILVEKE